MESDQLVTASQSSTREGQGAKIARVTLEKLAGAKIPKAQLICCFEIEAFKKNMKTEDLIAGKNGKGLLFKKKKFLLNKFDWKKAEKNTEVLIINIWENFPFFMHLKFQLGDKT